MNFQEYFNSMSYDAKQSFLDRTAKYDDPDKIIKELFSIPPCLQNKHLDIRINQHYLLWHQCKTFLFPARTYLIETEAIKYCYHSYAKGIDRSTIGIINNDDTRIEFKVDNSNDAIIIANAISNCTGWFEKIRPYSSEEKSIEVKLRDPTYANGYYVFKNNAIYMEHPTLFRGYMSKVVVEDINDIIWCDQFFASDSEVADTYQTTLYFLKNKRKTYPLFSDSVYGNFRFVLELKKRVPHLMYGYNEEYKKIHKKNPEKLMEIAIAKMKN